MSTIRRWLIPAIAVTTIVATGLSVAAVNQLKILVPANPGGGWDQTARALQAAMQGGEVKAVTIENKGGAGGTIGLAQFVNAKGDPELYPQIRTPACGSIFTLTLLVGFFLVCHPRHYT